MRVLLALLIGLAAAFPAVAQQSINSQPASAPPLGAGSPAAGLWQTDGGKSHVQITDCGQQICANIIWLQQPFDRKGRPLRDGNNENSAMRSRMIMGLPLFEGMRPVTGGWAGRIYNPEDGGTFDVRLWLGSASQLNIKGCVLFVCETHSWVRIASSPGMQAPAAGQPAQGAGAVPSPSPAAPPAFTPAPPPRDPFQTR